MFWVCFPPPSLNRAWDRLRRSYEHSTIGDFGAKHWQKTRPKLYLQNKTRQNKTKQKQTIK